jgi:hypothetical protein
LIYSKLGEECEYQCDGVIARVRRIARRHPYYSTVEVDC